jgi:hypothetical protein
MRDYVDILLQSKIIEINLRSELFKDPEHRTLLAKKSKKILEKVEEEIYSNEYLYIQKNVSESLLEVMAKKKIKVDDLLASTDLDPVFLEKLICRFVSEKELVDNQMKLQQLFMQLFSSKVDFFPIKNIHSLTPLYLLRFSNNPIEEYVMKHGENEVFFWYSIVQDEWFIALEH